MPAVYTDKIYDILQRENPEANLSTIEGIRDAAKKSLYTEEMLSFIDEQHRDAFAAGFALHYLQDEIGYPAFSAWQIALLEKVVNNADFINLVYDNLDKQVFANYRMTKAKHAGTHSATTTPDLTDMTTYDSTNTATKTGAEKQTGSTSGEHTSTSNAGKTQSTTEDTAATTSNDTASGTSTTETTTHNEGTSSSDTTNTGTVETKGTGTVTTDNEGTTTTKNTGTVETSDTANDTGTKSENYTDTTTPSGSKTTSNSGNTVTTEHGAQHTDGWNQFSDTPQNGLNAVKSGTYLTNATYNEGNVTAYTDTTDTGESTVTETYSNYKEQHTHSAEAADNTTTNQHTGESTRTDDLTQATTVDTSNTETRNTTDTRTDNTKSNVKGTTSDDGTSSVSGETSTTATGNTNTTANGTTTTEQLTDASESGSESGTSEHTLTFENRKDTNEHSGTDTTTHTGTTTTDGSEDATDESETFELNMAMLLQAEPLMSRIWRLFDDLFMMVYDTYNYWN